MDPLQILVHDPHVVRIERAEKLTPPLIDMTLFKPTEHKHVRDFIHEMCITLQSDCIIDDFKTHEERRAWRSSLKTKYGHDVFEYASANPLRLNNIHGTYYGIQLLKESYCGPKRPTFCTLCNAVHAQPLLNNYDKTPLDAKLKLLHDIKENVRTIFAFLTAMSNAHIINTKS